MFFQRYGVFSWELNTGLVVCHCTTQCSSSSRLDSPWKKKRTGFVENEKNPKQNSRNQMMGADQKRCLEERHVKPRIIHHLNSRDDWYTKAPIKVTKHVLYGLVDGEHACLSMAPTLPSCLPASEPVSPSLHPP